MTPVELPRELAQRALAEQPLLSGLDDATLDDLVDRVDLYAVEAGETLMHEGDEADSAFLVVTGRLAVSAAQGPDQSVGKGEVIGELALLTDTPRSATVVAARDTIVTRLGRAMFAEFFNRHPGVQRRIVGQVIERLRATATPTVPTDPAAVLTVVTDGRTLTRTIVDDLAAAARRRDMTVATVEQLAADPAQALDLARLEASQDLVLIVPDAEDPEALAWAVRQCDRIVFAVDAGSPRAAPESPTARLELVLVHEPETPLPSQTGAWLDRIQPADHRHVRAADPADHDRLLRHLLDDERVLVLGGGGARGLAHIGVHRAMVESDLPIDAVVSVSAGALIGAGIARGHDPDQLRAECDEFMISASSPIDRTLPLVALARGAELTERLRSAYEGPEGPVEIEDLWLPFCCLSANLTTVDVHPHRRGPVWRALRATVAIPGVFPPLAEPDGLLVDGGIVDNLPVTLARELFPGSSVVASDVGLRHEMPAADFPDDGVVSGWSALLGRVLPGRTRLPSIATLLHRLTSLGGVGLVEDRGDVHLDHDLAAYGRFDFKQGHDIIEAGYAEAVRELRDLGWQEGQPN